jgi:hypothetical protein
MGAIVASRRANGCHGMPAGQTAGDPISLPVISLWSANVLLMFDF